jgi:hypothetical protein
VLIGFFTQKQNNNAYWVDGRQQAHTAAHRLSAREEKTSDKHRRFLLYPISFIQLAPNNLI